MGVFQRRPSGGPGLVSRPDRPRVPPNQAVTTSFPTLTAEQVPSVDVNNFTLRFWGEVQEPTEITWQQLMAVKHTTLAADFHCVTGWSMLGTEWGGALVRDVLELSLIHISEPTRLGMISYAVFC